MLFEPLGLPVDVRKCRLGVPPRSPFGSRRRRSAVALAAGLVAGCAEFAVRAPVRPHARIGEVAAEIVQQLDVVAMPVKSQLGDHSSLG